jgi:hypothetical protein
MSLVEKKDETAKTEKYSYMLKEIHVINSSPCSQSLIRVGQITSSPRKVNQVTRKRKRNDDEPAPGYMACNELDT